MWSLNQSHSTLWIVALASLWGDKCGYWTSGNWFTLILTRFDDCTSSNGFSRHKRNNIMTFLFATPLKVIILKTWLLVDLVTLVMEVMLRTSISSSISRDTCIDHSGAGNDLWAATLSEIQQNWATQAKYLYVNRSCDARRKREEVRMKVSTKSEAMDLRQKMVHHIVQVGSALLLSSSILGYCQWMKVKR